MEGGEVRVGEGMSPLPHQSYRAIRGPYGKLTVVLSPLAEMVKVPEAVEL